MEPLREVVIIGCRARRPSPVAEAAKRLGKHPETIRRWIRSGKLPAKKVGLQHRIEEVDLPSEEPTYLPAAWRRTATGEEMPDVVAAIRRTRAGR